MKKSTILWCLTLIAVACLSSALTGLYYGHHPQSITPAARDITLIDWEEAQLPEDLKETEPENPIVDAGNIPSQLTEIHLPGVACVRKPGEEEEEKVLPPDSKPAAITLESVSQKVVPLGEAEKVEGLAQEDSARVMIQAPVRYRLINTLEEYKEFKRKARGSYPEVNFASNRVLVLESDSNLPDNLFEIVDVTRTDDDKVLVTYRVDIISLNEKTNTHSVKVLKKSNREIELKQVL